MTRAIIFSLLLLASSGWVPAASPSKRFSVEDCETTTPGIDGFIYLKQWPINDQSFERSYVFTNNTNYIFKFCAQPNPEGVLIIEDACQKPHYQT